MVIKQFLLLGQAAEYRSRQWMWSTLSPTIRCLLFMTLTDELSRQRLRRSAVDLLLKKRKNRSLSHPVGDLGVMYTLHVWLIGKLVVDFLFVVIETFFAISYGWDVMSGNWLKSAFFERGVSLSANICQGRGHCPPTAVGLRKLERLPFRVVSKYPQSII